MLAKIATGEIEGVTTDGGNAAAVALGAWAATRGPREDDEKAKRDYRARCQS